MERVEGGRRVTEGVGDMLYPHRRCMCARVDARDADVPRAIARCSSLSRCGAGAAADKSLPASRRRVPTRDPHESRGAVQSQCTPTAFSRARRRQRGAYTSRVRVCTPHFRSRRLLDTQDAIARRTWACAAPLAPGAARRFSHRVVDFAAAAARVAAPAPKEARAVWRKQPKRCSPRRCPASDSVASIRRDRRVVGDRRTRDREYVRSVARSGGGEQMRTMTAAQRLHAFRRARKVLH